MTFDEHVQQHKQPDGTFDLDAAEAARAAELAGSPDLAEKAAKTERRAWESANRDRLHKQFHQPALSPSLELDVKVPLGDNTAVELGDMNQVRIQIRKDLATRNHLNHTRAYDAEMTFWLDTEKLLPPGGTLGDAIP